MGILNDLTSTVLTVYKVDVKPAKEGLKELKGAQKEQAEAAIAASEKQNTAIDNQLAMLGKATLAVGAVVAAYKLAEVGLEAYEKRSRLSAATVGVDLIGLQNATKGLVSETRLLEFASKAMNGTFKLSQSQMEQAVTGALALRKTLGVDLQKALEITQKSLVEGSVEPLKELGIVIKDVENDTREGLNAALKELAQQAKLAGPDLRIPGDEMTEAQVAMSDSVEQLKISLGGLAQSLSPVIAKLAEMVAHLASAVSWAGQFGEYAGYLKYANPLTAGPALAAKMFGGGGGGNGGFIGQAIEQIELNRQFFANIEATNNSIAMAGGSLGQHGPTLSYAEDEARKKSIAAKGGGAYRINTQDLKGGLGDGGLQVGNDNFDAWLSEQGRVSRGEKADNLSGIKEEDRLAEIERIERLSAFAAEAHAYENSAMSAIFGTPAEMDAQTMAIQQLGNAMDGLAGAFGAGVDAMITGSESFASAFNKAIGESLRAMATDMTVRAIREAAMGFGQLALGNVGSAATHAKAAAMYGAGAIAAGVGARSFGAGQSGATAGGARAPSTTGSAGVGSAQPANGNQGGSQKIIILGDDYGSLSARERESRIRETMRGAGISIEGDFAVNG